MNTDISAQLFIVLFGCVRSDNICLGAGNLAPLEEDRIFRHEQRFTIVKDMVVKELLS